MNVLIKLLSLAFVSTTALGQSPADLILVNGNVRTLDRSRPRAEAIAAAGGRIVAVGSNAAVRRLAAPGTKIIDARGRLVIPGFNDSHVHFTAIGNRFSHLDLKGAGSPADVIARMAEFVRLMPKGRWLLGSGLDVNNKPSLDEIDAVSPDHPLLIYFSDPTSALVNSAALLRAGSIAGVKGNSAGRPAGVVTGAAVTVVRNAVPADHYTNWAQIAEIASNYAASLGVTSVHDMHSDDLSATLRGMAKAGRLKTRVYDCVWITDRNKLAQAGVKAASGDAMVRTGCVKAMSEGNADELPELRRSFTEADKAGLQLMVHAIGERANAHTVAIFESASAQNGPRDRRFRIEHAHRMNPTLYPRLSRSSILTSMQPFLFYSGAGGDSDDYRKLLQRGVRVAFGSDASIIDFNPLLGIHAAVNVGSEDALTVEQAVTAYTLGSAFAEFQEEEKGTLAVGKLADFVILSEDIFAIDPSAINRVSVIATVMDGKVVYEVK